MDNIVRLPNTRRLPILRLVDVKPVSPITQAIDMLSSHESEAVARFGSNAAIIRKQDEEEHALLAAGPGDQS